MKLAESDAIWTRGGVPVEELPDPFSFESPPPVAAPDEQPAKRRRRWPLVLYSIAGLFFITIVWLAITAPLSRALEPLPDPALLLLSDDGHPVTSQVLDRTRAAGLLRRLPPTALRKHNPAECERDDQNNSNGPNGPNDRDHSTTPCHSQPSTGRLIEKMRMR